MDQASEALINALGEIPIEELVACARENLKATRPVRLSKEETIEAPDYFVRQKTLEWITAHRAGTAPRRSSTAGGAKRAVSPGTLAVERMIFKGQPVVPEEPVEADEEQRD